MATETHAAGEQLLSIGAMAHATGIPEGTLRTWERRYGFPEPVRRTSGHRRYRLGAVEQLRIVRDLIRRGHKASTLLGLGVEDLQRLQVLTGPPRASAPPPSVYDTPLEIEGWLRRAGAFDGDGLSEAMSQAWEQLGPQRFIYQRALPFMDEVGRWWEAGALEVMHEHFASERLRDFLGPRWRTLVSPNRGRPVVLTTLPGEQHALGLHMAATLLALHDHRITFLGADTPEEDITASVKAVGAQALIVGSSTAAYLTGVRMSVTKLRACIDGGVEIVLGGCSTPVLVEGVRWMSRLDELERWAQAGPSA